MHYRPKNYLVRYALSGEAIRTYTTQRGAEVAARHRSAEDVLEIMWLDDAGHPTVCLATATQGVVERTTYGLSKGRRTQ